VLTVRDLNKTTHFYSKVLGMEVVTFKVKRHTKTSQYHMVAAKYKDSQ